MSQREEVEEAASPGDAAAAAAPDDPIDIAPGSTSSAAPVDLFAEQSVSEKPIDVSSGNEAVQVLVSQGTDDAVGNGREEVATNNVSRDDVAEEDFDPRAGERSDVKEATTTEPLTNGLHHIELGGVVGPAGGRDQHNVETPGQHTELSHYQASYPGAGKVSSPRKGLDNGSEGLQRPGGAVEQHRKSPLGGSHHPRSSDGPEVYPSRPASGKNLVGDVLSSFASEDEEGRSRQRILAFAAKRYSTAVERNPDDYDSFYNWALVLQVCLEGKITRRSILRSLKGLTSSRCVKESADSTAPESGNSAKDSLLEEACRKYKAATELCPTLHEAFYNWAIAISDRAKIRGRTKEAEELWKQACERYDKSVQLNWNSPQALNNWGLALQELGAIVPLREKRAIVKKAIRKFRSAIRLRFDFHRAVYNLGTVLYGLAEDTVRGGRKLSVREPTPNDLYSHSAIYIAAAHALKPDYPVYRSALRLVRPMLPLPYVKAGYLTIPPVGDSLAPHSEWQRLWFVLNHEALYEMEKPDLKGVPGSTSRRSSGIGESSNSSSSSGQPIVRIEMEDIVFMTSSADLSLPPGGGFRIDTTTGHQFLIADTWEAMDGWVDAIRLVYTIFARGKRDSLAGVLAG